MRTEINKLYEYLETKFSDIDTQLDKLKVDVAATQRLTIKLAGEMEAVKRGLFNLTEHVDRRNDAIDDQYEDHEQRISLLESQISVNNI